MDCNCAVLEGGQLAGHYYMSMQPEIQIDVLMNVSHIGDISWIYCFVIHEYYYYYCVFLYSCVLGCFPGFKWPECGSENSPQSNVKIYSNFLLAFPYRWVNINTTTLVLQSGSQGSQAIFGPNIPQYFPLKLFWQYLIITIIIFIIIINARSVETPRTRGEDVIQMSRGMHYAF